MTFGIESGVTRGLLGLLFHALVAVHHTLVGGHHCSVDSRS